jgi:DNA-binding GntR family transcriptional regulator
VPAVPLYRRIADAYRARIVAGVYAPGEQLPGQKAIAEEWDCSLQPVKWALRELELAGLIESRQGIGAFVKTDTGSDNT